MIYTVIIIALLLICMLNLLSMAGYFDVFKKYTLLNFNKLLKSVLNIFYMVSQLYFTYVINKWYNRYAKSSLKINNSRFIISKKIIDFDKLEQSGYNIGIITKLNLDFFLKDIKYGGRLDANKLTAYEKMCKFWLIDVNSKEFCQVINN